MRTFLRHAGFGAGFAAIVLATPGHTQGTLVSPAGLDNVAGNAISSLPFRRGRFLQIHSDLGATPRVFRALALRQAPGNLVSTGTLAVDLELWAGNARPHDRVSLVFTDNYATPRVNAITRKLVNFGPQGQQAYPSPFQGMDLIFDFPVVYIGAFSFAWEVQTHAVTANGTWAWTDAQRSSYGGSTQGTTTGAGCNDMTQYVDLADNGGTLGCAFRCMSMPPNQQAVLALGTTNPDLPVVGLCSRLLTDLALVLPMGSTGSGTFETTGPGTLFVPNTMGGVTLYSQFHALDPNQTGIPLRNSSGKAFTVPVPNVGTVVRVSNVSSLIAPDAPIGTFAYLGIAGCGVVTQFTH